MVFTRKAYAKYDFGPLLELFFQGRSKPNANPDYVRIHFWREGLRQMRFRMHVGIIFQGRSKPNAISDSVRIRFLREGLSQMRFRILFGFVRIRSEIVF